MPDEPTCRVTVYLLKWYFHCEPCDLTVGRWSDNPECPDCRAPMQQLGEPVAIDTDDLPEDD